MSDPVRDDPYYDYDFPEEERSYSTHIAPRRFYIFLETFLVMLVSFLIWIGVSYLVDLIPETGNPYQNLFNYSLSVIYLIIAVILSLTFVQLVFHKSSLPMIKSAPPLKETVTLFTFKKFGKQLFYTLLLLFLVYIPLDFITYAIPGGLEFTQKSLGGSEVNVFLSFTNFGQFILYGTLLYLMVGFREELLYRGYMTIRSEKYVNPGSAVVMSSIFFGFSHLGYLIIGLYQGTVNLAQDLHPALIWTVGAFFVGSVSAVFILKKRMIWPIILAHTLNNVISSSVLWLNGVNNVNFWDIAKFLYLPLLGVSVLIVIIFFREVKSGVKAYFGIFKSYKEVIPERNPRGKAVIADIIFGLIFWAIGMAVPA